MKTSETLNGTAFSRDPITGFNKLSGSFYSKSASTQSEKSNPIEYLEYLLPSIYRELNAKLRELEGNFRDMIEVEFIIQDNFLTIVKTFLGHRSARATIRIAVEMAEAGLISKQDAILRVHPDHIEALLHPQFEEIAKRVMINEGNLLATAVNAAPGAAVGKIIFDTKRLRSIARSENEFVILACMELTPEDAANIDLVNGLIAHQGGATSHAAVIARQMGVPCVVGVEEMQIDLVTRSMKIKEIEIQEYDLISIDGGNGEILLGAINITSPDYFQEEYLIKLLSWADTFRTLRIRTNSDTPDDAALARSLGAEGIGVCRTEHMFIKRERLPIIQDVIIAESGSELENISLVRLLDWQRNDFIALFTVMAELPIIIRLLDIPLHEILPTPDRVATNIYNSTKAELSRKSEPQAQEIVDAIDKLHELNPMLGLRGVRLGILRPAIYQMQVRAIIEATVEVRKRGKKVYPEIMIPLTSTAQELAHVKELVSQTANSVAIEQGLEIEFTFGTMIETPRAAVIAKQLAQLSDFFSFGTNDLTQLTFGISRDDAEGKFLLQFVEQGLLTNNPFQTLDEEGVGKLIQTAVHDARAVKPEIELGICGEHGGDPTTIKFCNKIGINYVSCSSLRIPIARLAAAQASLTIGLYN